jgi:hypothetical protein
LPHHPWSIDQATDNGQATESTPGVHGVIVIVDQPFFERRFANRAYASETTTWGYNASQVPSPLAAAAHWGSPRRIGDRRGA